MKLIGIVLGFLSLFTCYNTKVASDDLSGIERTVVQSNNMIKYSYNYVLTSMI